MTQTGDIAESSASGGTTGGRLFGFEISTSSGQGHEAINVSQDERMVSVAAGAISTLLGLSRGGLPGLLIAGIGGGLIYRGITGNCPLYSQLGINSAEDAAPNYSSRGIEVTETFLVSKPAEQLYAYWRDLQNLPRIMHHLKAVEVRDERTSHWIANAPKLAGGQVEWDAEITQDEPNRLIAWRSLPGAEVDNNGSIRFDPALGDRGTEVRVRMEYIPPAGRVGNWIATLFGKGAERQIREGLRNFKQIMECGEIPTVAGQPQGTCTGQGTRSSG